MYLENMKFYLDLKIVRMQSKCLTYIILEVKMEKQLKILFLNIVTKIWKKLFKKQKREH